MPRASETHLLRAAVLPLVLETTAPLLVQNFVSTHCFDASSLLFTAILCSHQNVVYNQHVVKIGAVLPVEHLDISNSSAAHRLPSACWPLVKHQLGQQKLLDLGQMK